MRARSGSPNERCSAPARPQGTAGERRAAHENELRDVKIAASFGRAQNKPCRLQPPSLSPPPPLYSGRLVSMRFACPQLLAPSRLSPPCFKRPRLSALCCCKVRCLSCFCPLFRLFYRWMEHGGGKVERTKFVFRFREERCPLYTVSTLISGTVTGRTRKQKGGALFRY